MPRDNRPNVSGSLALHGGVLSYELEGRRVWELPAQEIAVVGAWTTSAGPFIDDYFLVLVRGDGMVYEAPMYADGRDDVLVALGAVLGGEIRPGLANSTTWRAEVVWPPALVGTPLYELTEARAHGIWNRLRSATGLGRVEAMLTAPIWRHLAERRGKSGPSGPSVVG